MSSVRILYLNSMNDAAIITPESTRRRENIYDQEAKKDSPVHDWLLRSSALRTLAIARAGINLNWS
jgi:hypothetical protein